MPFQRNRYWVRRSNAWVGALAAIGICFLSPRTALGQYTVAQARADFAQMLLECRTSGGTPSATTMMEWGRLKGCICPGSSVGSGQVKCSGSAGASTANTAIPGVDPTISALAAMAMPRVNPALSIAILDLGFALGKWLVGGNDDDAAAQQQQTFLAELEVKRQAAKRQRLLEEQQRQQAVFDRLRRELKGLSGDAATLALKGVDGNPGPLHLKVRDSTEATGLKLKLDGTDGAIRAGDCKSSGIDGLPGLYLSDCAVGSTHTTDVVGSGNPVQLAQAAQSLSGPEQALVETKVLRLAEASPDSLGLPRDPRAASFRAADSVYQRALADQAGAATDLEQARTQTDATKEASQMAQATVAEQQAAGKAAPPEVVQALNKLAIVAKTNEEASVRAEQAFSDVGANVVVARTQAIRSLSAMSSPGETPVVDLRDKLAPTVVHPEQLHLGVPTPITAQSVGVSAPGHPIFDCVADAAAIRRLPSGLPAQQEAIRRAQAALDAAREDVQRHSIEARNAAIERTITMLASTADFIAGSSERLLAREEGVKAAGITPAAATRFKFLQNVRHIADLSQKLVAAAQSYEAGHAFADAVFVQQTARELRSLIAETNTLLVDSGIWEELGGKGAFALWGPIGELGWSGLNTGLDLVTAGAQSEISAAETDRAARNLDAMQSAYTSTRDRLYELQKEVAENCPNAPAKPEP